MSQPYHRLLGFSLSQNLILIYLLQLRWLRCPYTSVTERCLVSLKFGSYSKDIYRDSVPMDVTHILLVRSWILITILRILDEITCVFSCTCKTIALKPATPDDTGS